MDRRTVLLSGPLTDTTATEIAAQLMTLDASGDDPLGLQINSGDGTLSAGLTLMDTIAALGVPVEALCLGQAEGPALGVLAVSARRRASAHSRLRLCDREMSASGSATELAAAVRCHRLLLERFVEQVARATGQPGERVEIDVAAARYFELDEALDYRLIDEVWAKPGAPG
ncbi:MAG: ATP-dependent Clp protease proteolytic subunit [Candidatus Dormibacteria bacterium]